MELRDYQREAVDAVLAGWAGGTKRPAVVLPTGMGKTVIFNELIRRAVDIGLRPLALMHRKELIDQTIAKLAVQAPNLRVGVIKGVRNEHAGRHTSIGSVQTIGRPERLEAFHPKDFTCVIVDECHHAAADSYVNVLRHFGAFDPSRDVGLAAGFTATMDRGDSKALSRVWDDVVYTKDVLWGIMHGYLVDVRGRAVPVEGMNLADVKISRGDYQDNDLADELIESGAMAATALAYNTEGRRADGSIRPGILFAPTVETAGLFSESFNSIGIPSAVIVGETPEDERTQIYADYAAGKIKVLHSCMVLTEGFDAPFAEVCVIARPTQMQHLYIQMVGRVLRPFPGKPDALVLDVVGITRSHTLASLNVLIPAVEGKPVELAPNESIVDGVVRTQDAIKYLRGELGKAADVDLFDRSQSAWLRTPGGTWFVPSKHGYFFLNMADDGTWRVGKTATQYRKQGPGHARYLPHGASGQAMPVLTDSWGWIYGGLTLDYAMAATEAVADELDGSVTSRKASWRSTRGPSDPQKALLDKYKIEYDPTMRRGAAGDLLSLYFATKLFDR